MNQSAPFYREATLVSSRGEATPTSVSAGYVAPPGPMHPPIGPPRSSRPSGSSIAAMAIGVVLVVVAAGALVVAISSRVSGGGSDGRTEAATSVNPATPVEPVATVAPAVTSTPAPAAIAEAPVVAPTPATAVVAEAPPAALPAAAPAVPSADVSPAVISDRFDGYLAAGSGFDVAAFVDQWAYPIRDYYGNHGVTADVVADKAGRFFDKYRSITFTRVGSPQITLSSDEVRATAPFAFEYVNLDGTTTCGTNTLTITFDRTAGLPISGVSERRGPDGC